MNTPTHGATGDCAGRAPQETPRKPRVESADPIPSQNPARERNSHRCWAIALAILILAALALRLYNGNAPLLSPGRQYDSALLAQAMYYADDSSLPQWKQSVMQAHRKNSFVMEPRIVEHLAAWGYRITGECQWLPRLFSSLFWCLSAIALYRLAGEMYGRAAAWISAAFFLLAPYAIFHSRIFQPDPLMVALMVTGFYALWVDFHRPSRLSMVAAVATVAAAMLVKPQCALLLVSAVVSLALAFHGVGKAIRSPRLWTLGLLAALPSVLYYGKALFITGSMQYQIPMQFRPNLIFSAEFWSGWALLMAVTVGIPALIVSILGVFVAPPGPARRFVIGLWCGYFAYGLVFSVAIHTHLYYHMPLVPVVALSFGAAVVAGGKCLWTAPRIFRYGTLAVVTLLTVLPVWIALSPGTSWLKTSIPAETRATIEKGLNLCGANTQFLKTWGSQHADLIGICERIGSLVNHSTKVIFLNSNGKNLLSYHGFLEARRWPGKPRGVDPRNETDSPPVEVVFQQICREMTPEYFIAWPTLDLDIQPDLKNFLEKRFSLLARTGGYAIYDLRTPRESSRFSPQTGPETVTRIP